MSASILLKHANYNGLPLFPTWLISPFPRLLQPLNIVMLHDVAPVDHLKLQQQSLAFVVLEISDTTDTPKLREDRVLYVALRFITT